MPTVEAIFSDGERFTFDARAGETVLAAARRHGLSLASDCESGECQTCVGTIKSGAVDYEDGVDISLSEADVAAGLALSCVATPRDNLAIALSYTRASLLPVRTAYL